VSERERIARMLRLRRRVEDRERAHLARRDAARRQAEDALAEAERAHVNLVSRVVGARSVNDLRFETEQLERSRRAVRRRQESLAEADERRREAAEALAVARRKVVALEKAEQRAVAEERRRIAKVEQDASDEAGARLAGSGS